MPKQDRPQLVFSKEYINAVVGRQIIRNVGKDIVSGIFLDAAERITDISALQRFLGVEDDGIIGSNTTNAIMSLQNVLGVSHLGTYIFWHISLTTK